MAARGIGGLIGGLLIAQLGQKFSTTQLTAGGLLISGAILLVIVNIPILYVALPLLVLAGIPLIAWIVSLQTILQQAAEDKYRGRVFGSFGMISAMLMAVGAGIGGGLTDLTGAGILMTIASLIFMFSGVLAWILLREPAEQLNASMNQAEAGS
jgi:predicted MFS family arabinose efflux permease